MVEDSAALLGIAIAGIGIFPSDQTGNTILANWARVIDQIVDEFGHLYGQVLNIGFLMRNPPRYTFDKYLKLFERYNDKQFVDTFILVKWLYDTPIIPGNLYRHVINDCYKSNLFQIK